MMDAAVMKSERPPLKQHSTDRKESRSEAVAESKTFAQLSKRWTVASGHGDVCGSR